MMAAPWGPSEYRLLVKLAYVCGANASEIAKSWQGRESEEVQLRERLKQLLLYDSNRAAYLKPMFKEREAEIGRTLTSFQDFINLIKDEEEEKEEEAQVNILLKEAHVVEGYVKEVELQELHNSEYGLGMMLAEREYGRVHSYMETIQCENRDLLAERSHEREEVAQLRILQAWRKSLVTPPRPYHYSPYRYSTPQHQRPYRQYTSPLQGPHQHFPHQRYEQQEPNPIILPPPQYPENVQRTLF